MDRRINEKFGALLKYVPFIDFIVEMKMGEYEKFRNIKKWIINKKRYRLRVLNKIEQSIIEQYKNLIVLDDKKIPQEITKLFCDETEQQCVNLCSDDEESETENGTSSNQIASITLPKSQMAVCDLKYSVAKEKSCNIPKGNDVTSNPSLDDISSNLLRQIDLVSDKKKCHNNNSKERVVGTISIDSSDEDICTFTVSKKITRLDGQKINLYSQIAIKECNVDSIPKKEEHPHKTTTKSKDGDKYTKVQDNPILTNLFNSRSVNSLLPNTVESETVANLTSSMSQSGKPSSSAAINQPPLHNQISGTCHLVQYLDTEPPALPIRIKNKCETPKISSAPCITTEEEYKEGKKKIYLKDARKRQRMMDETRSILLSTLQPYEEKLASMWEFHKKTKNTNTNMPSERFSREKENTVDVCEKNAETNKVNEEKQKDFSKTGTEKDKSDKTIKNDHIHNKFNEDKEILEASHRDTGKSKRTNKETKKNDQISRIFKELECTFKGYEKCTAQTIGCKRRSSVHARTAIAELLNVQTVETTAINSSRTSTEQSLGCTSSDEYASVAAGADFSTSQSLTATFKDGKRLSSVPARSAIAEQLTSETIESVDNTDECDSELSSAESCAAKRRKTIDEVLMPVERNKETKKDGQISRIFKELECTFKGYEKFTPQTIGCKRRSSVHARAAIAELLNVQTVETTATNSSRTSTEQSVGCTSSDEYASVDTGTDFSTSQSLTTSFKDGKRLSSVHARSAIAVQLSSETIDSVDNTDDGDSELSSAESCASKRRKTIDEVSMPAERNEEKNKLDRTSRIFKELECTFKGYDKFTSRTIGSKRRSSVHARTAIAELLNVQTVESTTIRSSRNSTEQSLGYKHCTSSDDNASVEAGTDFSTSQSLTTSFKDGKRLSSVHARSAIAVQLSSETIDSVDNTDESDSELSSAKSCASERRQTVDEVSMSVEGKRQPCVVEKLNDHPNNCFHTSPSSRSCNRKHRMRIYDSDSEPVLNDFAKFCKERIIQNQPRVVLKRLTVDILRKHTKQSENLGENNTKSCNILNVQLVESRIQPDTTEVVSETPTAAMIGLPRQLNNDSTMTENNTTFCTLCSSKPSDLTNHYIRKHKSESYVSRLTWSQLNDLSVNTPFAKMLPSPNNRSTIYSVTCPFCNEELLEPLMNLYMHYSTHTGEYAFRCSGCQLQKPFKTDIQSHQLHSKTCRSSRVQTMYLYPPNAMIIYLHYCNICYFVQLNEANVLRHLRIHHDERQATSHNVKKCILVAITDGPDISNELPRTGTDSNNQNRQDQSNVIHNIKENEKLRKDCMSEVTGTEINLNLDDDIPVRNEACSEELSDSVTYLLEEQLKQIHEDPPLKTAIPKIEDLEPKSFTTKTLPRFASTHFPNVIDFGDNCLTPPRPSLQKITTNISSVKTTYRFYPSNVKYMGLYKCVADDCYYSTDSSNEILKHLEDHGRENISGEYLQCAYCSILEGTSISAQQLIDHIGKKHLHMIFQCSMCCYRSCEASNVRVHQEERHADSYQTCAVYKGYGKQIIYNPQYMNEKIAENVRKLQCKYCSHMSFYNSNLLEHHIKTDHKHHVPESLKYYSCFYCHLVHNDESLIRTHVALKHPEELPYVCGHNNSISDTTDLLHNLQAYNLARPVPVVEINATLDAVIEKNHKPSVEDVKPSSEELVKYQEETVKVRLRKLTEHTGVAPDSLYHCSESSCGGFFSIYDLWLRHMRAKHNLYECQCPHCPIQISRPLEVYKEHFEEHRRHTYICFHCPLTFGNNQDVKVHASTEHSALGSMRSEQISFNLNYSYFVLIQTDMLTVRSEFMAELLTTLNNRLQELQISESKNLKRSWLISSHSAPWLEDYEKYISRKLKMKCFNDNCSFRATENSVLFKHVRENHKISGTTFNCFQCDFNLQGCKEWDGILNHIKQHSDPSFFICDACSSYHYSRRRLTNHIREEHAARDVPVINLIKKGKNIYLSLSVVFASERLSFSTLRNCFCCEERDMKSDAFILHLKRYHKLVLNYVCEWCNLPIESLQAADKHFKVVHTRNRLKIRCDLASKSDLSVISICNLRIHIDRGKAEGVTTPLTVVKPEPNNDDSVILLEDDDVVAENYVKNQDKIANKSEKPKLKCIAMANFFNPSLPSSTDSGYSNLQVPQTSTTTSKVASTNNERTDFYQQHVVVPSARITNHPASNIMDCHQYGITSSGTVTGPLPSLQNGKSVNSHTQVSVPIYRFQNTEKFSVKPNVTTTLHAQQPVAPSLSESANGPTTNSIIPNQARTGFLPTTITQTLPDGRYNYSHSHVPSPTSNIDKSLQNAHPLHEQAESNSKDMNGPAPNIVTCNQYRAPSSNPVAAPITTASVALHLSYSHPRVSVAASQSRAVTPYIHLQQQVAASSPRSLTTPTSNSAISNQYRIASSRDVPANATMQGLPNESSIHSDPQVYARSSNINSHVQNQNTHHRQYRPKPSQSNTSHTPVNTGTQIMYASTTVATSFLNLSVTGQNITSSNTPETSNPTQNMFAPSTLDGVTNHPVNTPSAMSGFMHQPPHLPVSATMSGMTNNQQPISGISTMYRMTNHPTTSAMSRLPSHTQHTYSAPSTTRIMTNPRPQQLPRPYGMTYPSHYNGMSYSSQHLPVPSSMHTMISQRPDLTSSRICGLTNHTQNITAQSIIRGITNQPQYTATQFTPNEMRNHMSFLTPSSNNEMAKLTQHEPVQSTVSGMINNSLHVPASMRGLTSPTQHMAVPFPISTMTNQTGTMNLYQPSSNNSHTPTANSSNIYMHQASRQQMAPIFDGSYTTDTSRFNGPQHQTG